MRLEFRRAGGGRFVAERRKEGGGNDFKGVVQKNGEVGLFEGGLGGC